MSLHKKMRHILTLNREEKLEFLNSFDTIVSDCDGVVWLILDEIPKTGTAVNLLKSVQKKYKFISNNSMRSDDDYMTKLHQIGVKNVDKNDLVHPVKTIIRHFRKINMTKPVYSMADNVFNTALKEAGFKIIEMGNDVFNSLKDFADYLPVKEKCGAVVFDIDCNLTLAKLTKAQLYLKDPDCEFIVGASDMLMPLVDNLTVMGPGGFIKMLSDITGRKPTILGKPGELLGDYIIENFNITDTKRALFIGDSLVQDIHFGQNFGFQTLLVLSGATKMETVDLLKYEKKPDYYADSMADFIDFFEDLLI